MFNFNKVNILNNQNFIIFEIPNFLNETYYQKIRDNLPDIYLEDVEKKFILDKKIGIQPFDGIYDKYILNNKILRNFHNQVYNEEFLEKMFNYFKKEILEARKPKEPCKLAPKPGKIKIIYDSDDTNCIKIFSSDGSISEFIIGGMQKIIVSNGENILLSEPLTDGAPNPHEMLNLHFNFYTNFISLYEAAKLSLQKVQTYLVNEVQNVYQSQNVDISDKHIEVIVRQMTSKVKVEDGGDTTLLPGELVELQQIENINEAMTLTKGIPATYSPVLLGITKSSLNTDSFISAASFQETTRVLTEAAIEGKADWLRGLKENVIIGRLIPAGTGFNSYSDISKSFNSDKKMQVSDEYYFSNETNKTSDFEDIVLDDAIAKNYNMINTTEDNFVKIKEE